MGTPPPRQVVAIPEEKATLGVTVQYLEEGNPIEVGVMPTSIKVVNT